MEKDERVRRAGKGISGNNERENGRIVQQEKGRLSYSYFFVCKSCDNEGRYEL